MSQVECPHCHKQCHFDESNPHRPFCSERCRLIDLGAWADETHRIAGEEVPSSDTAEHTEHNYTH